MPFETIFRNCRESFGKIRILMLLETKFWNCRENLSSNEAKWYILTLFEGGGGTMGPTPGSPSVLFLFSHKNPKFLMYVILMTFHG